jgi:hypothetical protein
MPNTPLDNPSESVTNRTSPDPESTGRDAGYSSWRLALDGEARQSTPGNTRASRGAAEQSESTSTPQLNADNFTLSSWERCAIGIYRSLRLNRRVVPATTVMTKRTIFSEGQRAVQRNAAPQRRGDPQETVCALTVSPSMLPMLASVFAPSLHFNEAASAVATTSTPSHDVGDATVFYPRQPLVPLLDYYLQIGYPLQLSRTRYATATTSSAGNSSCDAFTSLLAKAADRLVKWFSAAWHTTTVVTGDITPSIRIAAPHSRTLALLPDVVKQTVLAHRMSPRTAATWVVRVFVGLMHAESARLAQERHVLYGESLSVVPAWPLSPGTMARIRVCAEVMRDAVYGLQGGVLPVVRLDERIAVRMGMDTGVEAEGNDINDDLATVAAAHPRACMETQRSKEEWNFFHLLVLQEAISLLLRGCLAGTSQARVNDTAADDSLGGYNGREIVRSDIRLPPVDRGHLLPSASSSYTVLEGLVRLALHMRLKYDACAPARLYHRTNANGQSAFFTPTYDFDSMPPWPHMESEQRVLHAVERRWVAFTLRATRQIAEIAMNYSRFVPTLVFVLEIR